MEPIEDPETGELVLWVAACANCHELLFDGADHTPTGEPICPNCQQKLDL